MRIYYNFSISFFFSFLCGIIISLFFPWFAQRKITFLLFSNSIYAIHISSNIHTNTHTYIFIFRLIHIRTAFIFHFFPFHLRFACIVSYRAALSLSHPSTRLACGLPRHIIIHYTTYYTYTISLDPSLFCLPHRNICCVCKTVKKRSIVTCCETEKYAREISHTIHICRFLLPGVAHRRYHHKFLFQPDYSASYL